MSSTPALSPALPPAATLDGDAHRTIDPDGTVRLESGTLIVTTHDRPITVRTPHGRVTILHHSRVRILQSTRLQIAAFTGTATLTTTDGTTQTITPEKPEPVPTPSSASTPGPAPAPAPAAQPASKPEEPSEQKDTRFSRLEVD